MLKTSVQCHSHQQDVLILMKAAKICVMQSFHHVDIDFMALFLTVVNRSLYLPILLRW